MNYQLIKAIDQSRELVIENLIRGSRENLLVSYLYYLVYNLKL